MLKLESTMFSPLLITQVNTEPSVYLDHWALRRFSSDPGLADRFVNLLVAAGGMLEVSFLNILEFAEVTDTGQVAAAECLLDRLTPGHIGFIDGIPKTVIENENRFLRRERELRDPHVDYRLLQVFATHKGRSLKPLSFQGFLTNQIPQIQSMCRTFMAELDPTLSAAREKAKTPEFAKILRKTPKGHPEVQYLTRYINIEALRCVVREGIQMTSNQWRDIFHMIVPMAYCKFVILDKTWASVGHQVQRRLRKRGHKVGMAEVFSERTLPDFWKALEREAVIIKEPETAQRTLPN